VRWSKRKPAVTGLSLCLLLILGIGSGLAVWQWSGNQSLKARLTQTENDATLLPILQFSESDMAVAADSLIQSFVRKAITNIWQRSAATNALPYFQIGRIKNNTASFLNVDRLRSLLRINLIRTGKVAIQLDKNDDPQSYSVRQEKAFMNNAKMREPDFILSGEVLQEDKSLGNMRREVYTTQLRLVSADGILIWEDNHNLTKELTRTAVGF
jgi:hypothetical protein